MLITNFASGELSPTLNGRIDLQQYYQAVSRLENFEIIPTGGIERRVGFKRLMELQNNDGPVNSRIIPFILDKNAVFIFQLSVYKITVWKQTISGMTKLQESTTPYSSMADINEIQYAQNYDEIIFCHRSYVPYMGKYANSMFTFSEMTFNFNPDIEVNDSYDFVMITNGTDPVQVENPGGGLCFNYTPLGTSTLVMKVYPLGVDKVYMIKNNEVYENTANGWKKNGTDPSIDTGLFTTPSKYPGCIAFFNNRLFLGSTTAARQKIWASAAPGTVDTRYNNFATYKKYVTINKVVKDPDLHTFTCDILVDNINKLDGTATLTNVSQNFTTDGILQKNATSYYVSGNYIPDGTKVLAITSTTIKINTSAIEIESDMTNQVMTIQLWVNGTTAGSQDYVYEIANQNITIADCSFNFELASDENDSIMFMSSNKFLSVGTESSIWSIPSGITALSIQAEMQGRYGSDDIQGAAVGQATVYFAQGKKGIREFYYDSMSEAFQTNNIALMANHLLTESAVIDFDYVTNPYNRIVITRYDGSIITMLYDKTNGIMGWNRLTRQKGTFTSVAVTRGNQENDLIFAVVKDNDHYYLEMMDNGQKIFLDSWQPYTEGITGYTSGAVVWNKTKDKVTSVSDAVIESGDEVYIGYRIKSYIKSMPLIANDPTGKKRITNLIIRFLDSYMPKLKITGLPDEKFNTITNVPYSGVANITYPGSSDRDVYFELETADVYPVNILNVNANIV